MITKETARQIIARGNKAKSTIYAIVFARVYIAMMR